MSRKRSKTPRHFHRGTRVAPESHQGVEGLSKGKQLTRSIQMAMVASELDRLRFYQGDDQVLAKNWRQSYDDVSDLHYAAFYGDLTSVKRIIKDMRSSTESLNVDILSTDGPKLLKEAKAKNEETYGKENYAGFFLFTTPLMMAAQQGCLSVVKYLVEHAQADVNACDSVGLTPLSLACSFNQQHIARYLLTRHAKRNSIENKNGMSPLILASINNHTDMCKFLVSHRATVYLADRFGRHAVHYAAWNYNWELVDYLYHHDITSFNVQDSNGNTPLHLLVSDEMIDPREADDIESGTGSQNLVHVFRQLAKFGNITIHIKRESRRGTKAFIEEHKCLVGMIEKGAKVYLQNNNGQTPLHVLCSRLTPTVYSQGYLFIEDLALTQKLLVMLRILLESGCCPNEPDFQDNTPLTLSVEKKNWLAAKILGASTPIRSEVTVDQFKTLSETVAKYGWAHLYRREKVEKDIEYMSSAAIYQQEETKKSKMADRILRS